MAVFRASFDAATAAPSRETRPWTRVPSMVKKRRPGLAMGERVVAVGVDVAVAVEQVGAGDPDVA